MHHSRRFSPWYSSPSNGSFSHKLSLDCELRNLVPWTSSMLVIYLVYEILSIALYVEASIQKDKEYSVPEHSHSECQTQIAAIEQFPDFRKGQHTVVHLVLVTTIFLVLLTLSIRLYSRLIVVTLFNIFWRSCMLHFQGLWRKFPLTRDRTHPCTQSDFVYILINIKTSPHKDFKCKQRCLRETSIPEKVWLIKLIVRWFTYFLVLFYLVIMANFDCRYSTGIVPV